MTKLSAAEVEELVCNNTGAGDSYDFSVVSVAPGRANLRLRYSKNMLRFGGTISGPVIMTLADAAIYAVLLAELGDAQMALTSNLSVDFLSRPDPGDLTAEARILKLGRRLAVCTVEIRSEDGDLLAHATGTYSIPPMPLDNAAQRRPESQRKSEKRQRMDEVVEFDVDDLDAIVPDTASETAAEPEELSTDDLIDFARSGRSAPK